MNIYCQLEFCPFLQETGCQLPTIHRLQGFKLIQKPEVLNLKLCLNSQNYSFKFECDLLPGSFMELRQNKFYLLEGLMMLEGILLQKFLSNQPSFTHSIILEAFTAGYIEENIKDDVSLFGV